MKCPHCGREEPEGAKFCTVTGAPLIQPRAKRPGARRVVTVLAVVAACGIAVLLVWLLGGLMGWWAQPGADYMLVAFAGRNETVDLALLGFGQDEDSGMVLAEDVKIHYSGIPVLEHGERVDYIYGYGGGFLHGSDHLLLWYTVDDVSVLQHMKVGAKEPTTLIESRAADLAAVWFRDSHELLVCESTGDRVRCSMVTEEGEVSRLASGQSWRLSQNGSTLLMDDVEGGNITLQAVDTGTKEQLVRLEGADAVTKYGMSDDGKWIYYRIRGSDEHSSLYVIERDTGNITQVSEDVRGVWGFAPASDVLVYDSFDEEKDVDGLYTSESSTPIAESYRIGGIEFSPDGQHLLYVLRDTEDREVLYMHTLDTGADMPLLEGYWFDLRMTPTDPPRLIVVTADEDEREKTFYSIGSDGRDLTLLLQVENAYTEVDYIRGSSLLYIVIARRREESDSMSIFVIPADRANGFYLLRGWTDIYPSGVSPDGQDLLFEGQGESWDTYALYLVPIEEGAEPIMLDRTDGVGSAAFAPDGRSVVYNVWSGDEPDDAEIRLVRADGAKDATVLYDKAFLVDVQWDDTY